jgi:hypothetical protein
MCSTGPSADGGRVSTQVWTATLDGRTHRVEAIDGFRRRVRWWVDDELAGEQTSVDDKVRIEAPAGRLEVRFSPLGAPRRATVGEVDLVPEAGSKAARHEDAVRAHPERYALIAALGGAAKVVVPILLTLLLARLAFSIPVDLPSLPLPSIPTPDLPSLPLPDLPDLPDWSLPGWVERVLDVAHYVWPVVLAYVLARAEIKRRRRQDARREESADE